ncbi:hypothetical protein SZ64_06380 [Erythrobacter sp. SG61-1L]|uniref:hypothetical protein n=1 Tax=Erythrobacter sp. SG61-1L TaxID=1603897 RepID=UPI0006C9031B|nr:hypothetical protein [Erythrobacter sp. SG61-1L]KPL67773.1 hypothetical protein SZ64_06380 [Erythrobacter sp. SG61-1L]
MKQAFSSFHRAMLVAVLATASPALADDGGRLSTLERGTYSCELPGDAATQRGVPVAEEAFVITNGSAYSAEGKAGTYLRIGDLVTMTSGPRKGNRYEVKSGRYLRKLDEKGEPTGLRCIRIGATPK